jgi:hypothetical protein
MVGDGLGPCRLNTLHVELLQVNSAELMQGIEEWRKFFPSYFMHGHGSDGSEICRGRSESRFVRGRIGGKVWSGARKNAVNTLRVFGNGIPVSSDRHGLSFPNCTVGRACHA